MERHEQRLILKTLQGIVNNRADADVMKVLSEVKVFANACPLADDTEKVETLADPTDDVPAVRDRKGTRNRKFVGGNDRG